jgi:FKBP-type peptidyl-prolyl cis-trans isomerase 2
MQKGDFVKIDYVGRLESGEIFDLTYAEIAKKEKIFNPSISYKPASVIIGAGFVIPGLDKTLLEMKPGEKRTVIIKPDDGFGQRSASLVRTVPSKLFKQIPVPGQIVDFGNLRGRVQSVSAGRIRVDFNHPMAGKNLNYEIEIKEKIEDVSKQVESIVEFFGLKGSVEIKDKTATIHVRAAPQAKERISKLVLEHVKGVEKINFIETFEKSASSETTSKS